MEWLAAPDQWIARVLFHRALGVIYLDAILLAVVQPRPPLRERGLRPIPRLVASLPVRQHPSHFYWRYSDRLAMGVSWAGVALAVAVIVGAGDLVPAPVAMLMWLALWALYLSIVNVGQTWYAFGWETLLLEV